MKRSIYICGILQIALLVGHGCSDTETPIVPPNSGPQPSLICNPDSGLIGEVFEITGEEFEVPALRNILFFSDSVEKRADSGSTFKIYASVPFGATTGPIAVKSNQQIFTTKSFKVRESYNPAALNTVWYNLTPPITALDSSVIDDLGFLRTWQATVQNDTVRISRAHFAPFGGYYLEYHFVLLHIAPNQLPQLLKAWVFSRDDTGLRKWDTLSVGMMKIQNWDANVALSGRFINTPYGWGSFTFWVTPNNIGL